MNETFSHVFEVEIPPAGIRPVVGEGNFFLIVEANTTLEIRRTGAAWQPYEQGDSEHLPPGETFARLEIKNTTGVACLAKIYVGFGRREQNRQSVMEPPTLIRSLFAGNLPANYTLQIPRATGAGDLRRKAVLVYNGSSELRLDVLDAAGAKCGFVPNEQGHTFPVSHPMAVRNPHGVAVECFVSELVWTSAT